MLLIEMTFDKRLLKNPVNQLVGEPKRVAYSITYEFMFLSKSLHTHAWFEAFLTVEVRTFI